MKKTLSLKDLRFIPFITHEYTGTIKEMKRGKQKYKFENSLAHGPKEYEVYIYKHIQA